MTIYETLKAAGCELAHHESDLYVKAAPGVKAMLASEPASNVRLFRADDGTGLWYEIAFAYDPFWSARLAR